MKAKNKFPWFDLELFRVKKGRDISYAIAIKSKSENDWNVYKDARNTFHKLNRAKLMTFFEKRELRTLETLKSFGNSIRVQ